MPLRVTQKLGWPIIILLSTVPLVLWGMMYALPDRFHGTSRIMQSVGQALGLVGFAMFSLNLVLGARLKFIENLFGGMNKVYLVHHILGGFAFVSLLLHPTLFISRYLIQGLGDVAIKTFLIPTTWDIRFGLIGLDLLLITLVITFYVNLPYQIWKLTHKLTGLAFFFGFLHVLAIPSDVSADQFLRGYMWFLGGIGLLAFTYRTIFGFLLIPRLKYVVKEIRRQSPAILEVVMAPMKKKMRYQPGQFLFINFPKHDGLEEVHPFSITSSPDDDTLSIGFKALGDYTRLLLSVQPGDIAHIEGPFGRTSYAYLPNPQQVWVAGGIGITPFLGMARALLKEDSHHVDLYYSLVDRNETAFVAELQAIANEKPNLRFFPHYAKEAGYLSGEMIQKQSGPLSEKDIILCGPPPMMKGLKEQFKVMHLNLRMIHSEEFSLSE